MRRPRDMSEELHHLTIARGSSLLRAGALSPVAWTEHLLARIAALDPVLDSFVRVIGERALAQARAAEDEIARGQYRGPLHGVPYAAKDIYDTGGIATTGGSRLGQFRVPERDASAVSRLGKAGDGHAGQADHPRVRLRRSRVLRPALAADSEPVGRAPLYGRARRAARATRSRPGSFQTALGSDTAVLDPPAGGAVAASPA